MIDKAVTRLLMVEDNPGDARLLREMLDEQRSLNIAFKHVDRLSIAEVSLAEGSVDIALLDLGLPDAQGLEVLQRARAAAPRVPLVVLTGLDDDELALRALHEGAQDYLVKGQIDTNGLVRALRHAIERKIVDDALFAEKERAQVTLSSIGDAVVCTDIRGNMTLLNAAAETLTGWTWADAAGRPIAEIVRILNATTQEMVPNPAARAIRQNRPVRLPANSVMIRRDGVEIPIEDTIAPIRDRAGMATGAVLVFRDVSAARSMAQELAHSAEHDFLTDLPNRMLLNDRINQAITLTKRHRMKVAVLFLDVDGFKHINDSLGHATGDKLLRMIATRLVGCVRGSDTVSRQGGDEFVALLSEVEVAEDAAITARRMLEAVAKVYLIDGHELHVTASIGVSVYPDDGADAEALIKNADTAMYQAKAKQRHSYRFFMPAMDLRAVERQAVEEGLRAALARKEMTLHFQPKIDLKTGALTGAEALVRWLHPTRGALLPPQFISIAEDCGLIVPIGSWVLRAACTQARAWVDAGLPRTRIAVNVSAMELCHEDFLENIFTVLGETGLDPNLLELELTESILLQDTEATRMVLRALTGVGIGLALDDFGTGYSSLSYLRRFPIGTLKIDQSFMQELTGEGNEKTLVAAIIGMGRSLGQTVVAEGVENEVHADILRELGCDQGQGYHFGRPLPADGFLSYLNNRALEASTDSRPSLVAAAGGH